MSQRNSTQQLSKMESAGIWIYEKINNSRLMIGMLAMIILTAISMRLNYVQGKWTANDPESRMLLPTGYASLDASLLFLLAMIVIGIHSKPINCAAIFLATVLASLSLWSSFSFTIAVDERPAYVATTERIAHLNENLIVANNKVGKWEGKSLETNSFNVKYDEKLDEAIAARNAIQKEIDNEKSSNHTAALAAFKKVESFTGGFIVADSARVFIRFIWSMAIVITPLLIVLIFTSEMKRSFTDKKNVITPDKQDETPDDIGSTPNTTNVIPITPSAALAPVFTEEYKERVRAMTQSEQYIVAKNAIINGHKPSHESIKKLGIGSGFAQEFLVRLRNENVIERNGRGHRIAEKG